MSENRKTAPKNLQKPQYRIELYQNTETAVTNVNVVLSSTHTFRGYHRMRSFDLIVFFQKIFILPPWKVSWFVPLHIACAMQDISSQHYLAYNIAYRYTLYIWSRSKCIQSSLLFTRDNYGTSPEWIQMDLKLGPPAFLQVQC